MDSTITLQCGQTSEIEQELLNMELLLNEKGAKSSNVRLDLPKSIVLADETIGINSINNIVLPSAVITQKLAPTMATKVTKLKSNGAEGVGSHHHTSTIFKIQQPSGEAKLSASQIKQAESKLNTG
jgi:hypothetical protein